MCFVKFEMIETLIYHVI